LTGMALPWLGFAFGFITAKFLGRTLEDTIAIAIETGVQNTGVSIVILWNTLKHPVGDLAGKFFINACQIFFYWAKLKSVLFV
jgi:sodium/bile acid cotransporter 3/5